MASTRQIEHLERKHKENPEGLTFAPLANAYRNSGQPERAIEILMQGLEHHPNHAPARIVLGRCHLDLGDDTSAESAFALVLDLDKENVVALKALADITERAARYDDAIRWLGQLLEADRNSEEAREQLERVINTKAVAEEAGEDERLVDDGSDGTVTPGADEAAELAEAVGEEAEPLVIDTPRGEAPGAAEDTVDELVPDASDASTEPLPSPWEPPAISSEVTEGLSVGEFDGPGGPSEETPSDQTTDVVPLETVEDGSGETPFAATLEAEDDINLTPASHNEFQAPDAAAGMSLSVGDENEFQARDEDEGLSLQAGAKNEFQVDQDGEELQLRGSEDNEFQQPSDAELLHPSMDQDFGHEPASVEPAETDLPSETAEPGMWSPPAQEDLAASGNPESQPDGTPEPLETPSAGFEPAEPVEAPFEESAPLPSPWGPAGDVEEQIPGGADEPSLADSDGVSEDESVTGLEVSADVEGTIDLEPGSLLADETAEDTGGAGDQAPVGTEDDLYPEVLGSDQDETTPIEVELPAGAEPEPEPEPAIVATETMAEVYLSQGHRSEALEVYRTLLLSTPGDARLSEKVSALEKELEGGGADGAESPLEAGDGSSVESSSGYAASATGGQTVKALFHGLLAAKPAAQVLPDAPTEEMPTSAGEIGDTGQEVVGEPTRPAQDSLSLSAIFGEDSSPVPPAVGRGSAEAEKGEGFSFDSFFGDEEGESGPKPPSGGQSKAREDEEDLDQFQSWLQGLKG